MRGIAVNVHIKNQNFKDIVAGKYLKVLIPYCQTFECNHLKSILLPIFISKSTLIFNSYFKR